MLESGATDLPTRCSDNFEEAVTEGSHMLYFPKTGSDTVQSATESTVTIDKDDVAILASPVRATKISRMFNNKELTVGLHNTEDQSRRDVQRDISENSFPLPDHEWNTSRAPDHRNDPEPAEYFIDRIAGHRGMGNQTEHKVRRCGHTTKDETYEPASGLCTSFIRCN